MCVKLFYCVVSTHVSPINYRKSLSVAILAQVPDSEIYFAPSIYLALLFISNSIP